MSRKLNKARLYEAEREKEIAPEEKPAFHLASRVGWMNDPNGFSRYQGEYHLFYQYHPYSTNWGPMHWGHAVSKDMLTWEHRPVAIAPDESYDSEGCFSGSAIELPDGRHLLMYTGVLPNPEAKEKKLSLEETNIQVQCLAIGDGTNYEKYEQNPVLTKEDLPEGGSRIDFRDPKVWLGNDGIYRCIVGNRPQDGSGQILLYTSEDCLHWKYKKVFAANGCRIGKMWECPDFFVLDGKAVLLTSPQDMEAVGLEYRAGNGSICVIGRYDEATDEFVEEKNQAVDYGIDFYAHQSVLTEDGRRVMIGWLQNWDTLGVRAAKQKWFGQMSLPREISMRDGKLIQQPLRELEAYRRDKISYENAIVDGLLTLDGIDGRYIDMEMEISAADEENVYRSIELHFAENEKHYCSVGFRPYDRELTIDRRYSGVCRSAMNRSECFAGKRNGTIKLRLILDRNSAEVFADDGEKVMSMAFYTEDDAKGISFVSDGKVKLNITKYSLIH